MENGDDRSPMSKAIAISSQITTIGLMMILPAIVGYYVDRWLGTVLLFIVLGLFFGVASAVFQLSKLVSQLNRSSESLSPTKPEDNGGPGERSS